MQVLPGCRGQGVGIALAIAVCQSPSGEARVIAQRRLNQTFAPPPPLLFPFPLRNKFEERFFLQEFTLTKGCVFQMFGSF